MAKPRHSRRAARVSVPNQERAIVSVEGNNLVGVLCKLSMTGGSVRLNKSFSRGTLGTIALQTATGRFSAAVEFMNTSREAQVQAFRFIHMDTTDRHQLEKALQQMLAKGLGDGHNSVLRPLAALAQLAFGVAKKAVS